MYEYSFSRSDFLLATLRQKRFRYLFRIQYYRLQKISEGSLTWSQEGRRRYQGRHPWAPELSKEKKIALSKLIDILERTLRDRIQTGRVLRLDP